MGKKDKAVNRQLNLLEKEIQHWKRFLGSLGWTPQLGFRDSSFVLYDSDWQGEADDNELEVVITPFLDLKVFCYEVCFNGRELDRAEAQILVKALWEGVKKVLQKRSKETSEE